MRGAGSLNGRWEMKGWNVEEKGVEDGRGGGEDVRGREESKRNENERIKLILQGGIWETRV